MKKRIRFAIISNAIALLVSLFLFKPFFEEMDDTLLAMIVEGAFGKRDAHLVYSNYLLGTIYKALQCVLPQIRWHSVLQYFFLFIGFSAVIYILTCYKKGKLISSILLLAAGYETYVSLQFTKTAAFTAGCGLIVLLVMIRDYLKGTNLFSNKTEQKTLAILSIILVIYGCLLRFEGAAIAVCVLGPVGLCFMIRFIIKNKQDKRWIIYFKCFIPLLILLILTTISDRLIYSSNEGWSAFVDYNSARTEMVDRRYDAFDYVQNSKTLEAMGVSQNDAEMYLTYMFPDTEEINADDIRNIIAAQPAKKIRLSMLKEWLKNLYETYFVLNSLVVGFVLLLGIALIEHKKKFILEHLVQTATMIVMLAYFQYSGRWSHRLSYSILLIEILVVVYIITEDTMEKIEQSPNDINPYNSCVNKYNMEVLIVVMLLFCLTGQWLGNRFEYNAYMRDRETVNYDVLHVYLEENRDTLFCADMFTFQNIFKYKVFKSMQEGDCQNVVTCGSWIFNSPIVNKQLDNFGYKNPVQALRSGNDNVRLIDNNCPDKKMLYITEHGDGHEYSAQIVDTIGGYNIYKVK